MSSVSNYVNSAAAYNSSVNQASGEDSASSVKKTKVRGKTIGEPELSEKASKYYEELKKKYSNMDFILVSRDQKDFAKVKTFGMKINDNGTASFFAVLKKSSDAQKARIEKRASEKREEKLVGSNFNFTV